MVGHQILFVMLLFSRFQNAQKGNSAVHPLEHTEKHVSCMQNPYKAILILVSGYMIYLKMYEYSLFLYKWVTILLDILRIHILINLHIYYINFWYVLGFRF